MDNNKLVLHAVAGSGKTQRIIDSLSREKEIAIITYTINNQEELRQRIIKHFNGEIPDNIHLFGVWQFLYNFCLVPLLPRNPKGIIFDGEILKKYVRRWDTYFTDNGYALSNKISKFLLDNAQQYPYISRIDEFFEEVYIDEIQDFTGYDLNLLCSLAQSKAKILCVGDFWQHTFGTSYAGNVNSGVISRFPDFKKKFENSGFLFDETSLQKSIRCTIETCDFVRENLGINIFTKNEKHGKVQFIQEEEKICEILNDPSIKKLFYKNHSTYDCQNSGNWGDSKGQTVENVCVVLNPTTFRLYKANKLSELAMGTTAKFYVACTRSLGDIYFIEQTKVNIKGNKE